MTVRVVVLTEEQYIILMHLVTTAVKELSNNPQLQSDPSFNEGCRLIAMVGKAIGNAQLYEL